MVLSHLEKARPVFAGSEERPRLFNVANDIIVLAARTQTSAAHLKGGRSGSISRAANSNGNTATQRRPFIRASLLSELKFRSSYIAASPSLRASHRSEITGKLVSLSY